MIIAFVALILILGLLMYVLSKDPKIEELGRIMFAFALLAILLGADKIVAFFTR